MNIYEKKYKETLERAKTLYENANGMILKKWVEQVFPELAESEDERMRKDCIKYLDWEYQHCSINEDKMKIEKCIAWLEKQGSPVLSNSSNIGKSAQKPTDKVEPKFKVGDYVVTTADSIVKIKAVNNEHYSIDNGMCFNMPYVDKYWHLWTIADAKDGDVLVDVHGNIGIYEKCDDFDWMSYCSLGHNGGFQDFKIEHENEKTYPATREQRELLFQKMKEAYISYRHRLESLKQRMEEKE